jgi:uncharacterized protein (TIGR02996 family)
MPKAKFDLGAIQTAIADDDAPGALAAALVAWRQTRAPALADLIDALSPAAGDSINALLAKIPTLSASELPVTANELAGVEDPRIAKAVATWALDPPTTSSSTYPFWTKSLDAMTRAGDVRVVPLVKKRLKMPQGGSQFWPKFYKALERALPKIEATQVSAVDDKLVGKLAKAAGKLAPVKRVETPAKKRTGAGGDPLALLKAGSVPPAIEALLERWRAGRAPAIADLIDRATRLLPSYDRSLALTDKAVAAAWEKAYATDPQAAMPQLLDNLVVGGPAVGEKQLVALGKLPDDPRIAMRLAELCAGPAASPERTNFWKLLLELLARIADPRVAPALCKTFQRFTSTSHNHQRQARRIIGDWAMTPPAPAPAGDVAQLAAALDELEAKRDTTERDLLTAIVEAWDDNGPRTVYADWLTDRQSPRGEVIVLACKEPKTDAETKRLRDLVRNTANLYGPLDAFASSWADDRNMGVQRGMPTRLSITHAISLLTWRRILGYPLLATIEQITFNTTTNLPPVDDFARVLVDPTAKRLRMVTRVPKGFEIEARGWSRQGDSLVRS